MKAAGLDLSCHLLDDIMVEAQFGHRLVCNQAALPHRHHDDLRICQSGVVLNHDFWPAYQSGRGILQVHLERQCQLVVLVNQH